MLRQEAYGWVQAAAKKQKSEGIALETALSQIEPIAKLLSTQEIQELCDLRSHLKYVDVLFARFC